MEFRWLIRVVCIMMIANLHFTDDILISLTNLSSIQIPISFFVSFHLHELVIITPLKGPHKKKNEARAKIIYFQVLTASADL
jgi:hypothetical protein